MLDFSCKDIEKKHVCRSKDMNKKSVCIFLMSSLVTSANLYCTMPAYSLTEPSYARHRIPANRLDRKMHTLRLVVGQTFTITMDCQTSTDYTWYLVQPTFEDHVQLLGKTVIPCNCPGGSGRTIFQFQALKTGQEIIKFEYARPWSWNIAQECTYTVVIREKGTDRQGKKSHIPPFMLPGSY